MALIKPENPLDLPDETVVVTQASGDDSQKPASTAWVKGLIGTVLQAASDVLGSLASVSTDGFLKKTANVISTVTQLTISDIQNFAASVLSVVGGVTKEPTGFPDRTSTTLAFDNGTRTFTISPTGGSFTAYVNGTAYTKTGAESLTISNTEGPHFLYYNSSGVLAELLAFDPELITNGAFIQYIYWDATNNIAIYKGEERHGIVMDSATHLHLHRTFGARYVSGFALEGFTEGNGSSNTHAQFTAASGQLNDEDIENVMSAISQIPVFYRLGTTGVLRRKTADTFPFIQSGSAGYTGANGRIAYNEFTGVTYQLTQVGEGNYIVMHFFGTNDPDQPTIAVLGAGQYASLELAQADIRDGTSGFAGLPFPEFVPTGAVILQSSSAFANSCKARVVRYSTASIYADLRRSNAYNIMGVDGNHSLLSGLDLDSHPQYLLRNLLTTKGDIYTRGVSVIERLGVGSDLTTLTASAASSTGLQWSVPLPQVLAPIHATTTLTITAATDTVLTGMTSTPGVGTYEVEFIGGNITCSSNADRTITFTIYVNGVAQATSAKTIGMTNNNTENALVVVADKVTVAAGQAIGVRWRGSVAGTTYSITQRSLKLMRCQ